MNHKNIVTKYSPPRAENFSKKDSFWKVDNIDSQIFLKIKYGKSLTSIQKVTSQTYRSEPFAK